MFPILLLAVSFLASVVWVIAVAVYYRGAEEESFRREYERQVIRVSDATARYDTAELRVASGIDTDRAIARAKCALAALRREREALTRLMTVGVASGFDL